MKKILALCLTVMLVLAMVPVIGVAAEDVLTLSAGNITGAKRGDTIEVAVSIANNPGISSAIFYIEYDENALEIVPYTYTDEEGEEVEESAINLGLGGFETTFSPTTENPFIVNFVNGIKNTSKNGDVAKIIFKVKDDAAFGTYELKVTSDAEVVFSVDKATSSMNSVDYTTVNGSIEVVCPHANTEKTVGGAPTCVDEGLTDGERCVDCGATLVAQTAIPATGHTEELVNAKAHTATEEGYTGDVVCSVCEEMLEEGEVVAAGHVVEEVEEKDATCEDAGNIAHYACTLCDAVFADAENITDEDALAAEDVVVAALGHKYGDWKVTKEATATEKGSKEKVCATCGDKVVEEIAALGTTADKNDTTDSKKDNGTTSPATNDVTNIYVVVAMLVAIAAASVVVLKKKA